ncbi:MAG: hypothetical protein HYV63_06905 [Candidatus Schekmanbacteria bacterium]|nr:hypothetical protein [Candidatus Schekmanbacteria bacterium]
MRTRKFARRLGIVMALYCPLSLLAPILATAEQLTQVRRWPAVRPATDGQRVRLGASDADELRVIYARDLGAGQRRVEVENEIGEVLYSGDIEAPIARFHPAQLVNGEALVRDSSRVTLAGETVGNGEWETYAGLAAGGHQVVIAWKPCLVRPCKATVFYRPADSFWRSRSWDRELFGVQLAPAASGTVAVATRENPVNRGWTLRQVSAADLLERGTLTEVAAAQTWSPGSSLSLEDPRLMAGAGASPELIGGAFDLAANATSGAAYTAAVGGALRKLATGAPTRGNAEIWGVRRGSARYFALELSGDRSALMKSQGGTAAAVAEVAGKAPVVALAEGRVWMATTVGLWRLVEN